MKNIVAKAGAAVLLFAASGCTSSDYGNTAGTGPRPARQCFWPNSISNFAVVNSNTVNVRVGRDIYRLDLFGVCPDLTWNSRIAVTTTGGSTVCVGSGMGTSIITRGPNRQQRRCAVQQVTAFTPEEAAALRGRERP